MEPEKKLTVKEIFEIENELLCMDREIRDMPIRKKSIPEEWWYGFSGIKKRMNRFVGWYAREKELRTMEAHWICYEHFYDLLCERCSRPNADLTCFKTKHFDPEPLLKPIRFLTFGQLMEGYNGTDI